MIIKRWNGSAFVEEHPKTKAQFVFNTGNTTSVFDEFDKIKPAFLPDIVFDSLQFYATTTGDVAAAGPRLTLAEALISAKNNADEDGRSVVGYYWVISTTGTITGLTGIQDTITSQQYATLQFRPQDAGSSDTANTSSGVLEVGDWFVIERVTGAGTSGSPWIFTASVINNSYELATTAIDGVVRLSSRTTYAALSGNSVVTEGVLKTVIDNASFAASGHVHGNILNGGTITSTVVAPTNTDTILISNTDDSGKIERGITIGTATTTYLRNDGTWGTPAGTYTLPAANATTLGGIELGSDTQQTVAANAVSATASRSYALQVNSAGQGVINVPWTDTTYSAGEGITLSSTTFRMTNPLYVQTATPTTSVTGTIWYDIN
jgi:hypothetical protein